MIVAQSKSLDQFETQIAVAWTEAQKRVRKTSLFYGGAIVPFKPPIDKAAAYAVMSMHCVEEPVWLHVCKTNDFSDDKIEAFEKIGIRCIDVGTRKYHATNAGSATEWIVKYDRLPHSVGVTKLIVVINKNNETGYLKSFKNAVPHIMRELYELEPSDADWWSVRVLSEAAKVVVAFVRVENGESVERKDSPDAIAKCIDFVAQFGDGNRPLTLGQYVNNLWTLGETLEAIHEKLAFWQKGLQRLAKAKNAAKVRLAQAKLNTFYVGNLPGVLLERCDHFFTKEVLHTHRFAIRVIVDDGGHAAISTNKLDCAALAAFLKRGEPGMWHHNEQMGALINGGPQYIETPPTKITAKKLVDLVQHPTLGPKKK